MTDNLKRVADPDRGEPPMESNLAKLIEHLPLPVAVLNRAGKTVMCNESFVQTYHEDILHFSPLKDAIQEPGSGWRTLSIRDRAEELNACRAQIINTAEGSMLILDPVDNEVLGRLDHLEKQVSSLQRLCSTDVLTGAWNRRHFEHTAASELERSQRYRQPTSLILIDLDHFKHVNDAFGHQAGDASLRELVSVVRCAIRSVDTLFRWGGEEFAVITASTGYRGAAMLAEKIRQVIEAHDFPIVGSLTASFGVAEHLVPEPIDIWFRRLDTALYQAKKAGRNRVAVARVGSSDVWAAESGRSVVRLVWSEAYECGEPNIDAQHRELFTLANTTLDASFKSETCPGEFAAAVDRLLAHIVMHFAYEEEALAVRNYDDLERHKAAHIALLNRTRELRAAVAVGKTTIGELVDFLAGKVVAQHLFSADKRFFPLFADESP
jgi:diguanylate cyclase (GGDEF)-like protein/hemerythrin-like metal-binding protein